MNVKLERTSSAFVVLDILPVSNSQTWFQHPKFILPRLIAPEWQFTRVAAAVTCLKKDREIESGLKNSKAFNKPRLLVSRDSRIVEMDKAGVTSLCGVSLGFLERSYTKQRWGNDWSLHFWEMRSYTVLRTPHRDNHSISVWNFMHFPVGMHVIRRERPRLKCPRHGAGYTSFVERKFE